jgi:hypothetical protein
MSGLPPKKYLDMTSVMDARKLPLAVVIQKGKDIKVYRVDSENSRAYFNSFDDPLMPSVDSVEKATKTFGKEISQESFLQTSVFPAQTGHSSSNKEYAIYRAKFENGKK